MQLNLRCNRTHSTVGKICFHREIHILYGTRIQNWPQWIPVTHIFCSIANIFFILRSYIVHKISIVFFCDIGFTKLCDEYSDSQLNSIIDLQQRILNSDFHNIYIYISSFLAQWNLQVNSRYPFKRPDSWLDPDPAGVVGQH